MSWRSSVAIDWPISATLDSRLSRVPELLDRLELGGPGRHPLEVLGGLDRDARLGRQRPDRVELVRRPVVRPVVVDVEQPEQFRAVDQRRRAQRVEALLDDGRPDALAARVVSVADREQRLERRPTGGGRQRPLREVADAGEVRGRQAAADLGRHVAVGMLEEDGGPIALEQDHRVVDQAGQDPVEVEPAADVARDAAQRLGPMEQVGDLVGALGAADHRPERVRRDPGDVEVARTERARRLADDEEDAPRLARTGDRHGQLGAVVGEDRQRVASSGRRAGCRASARDRSGPGRRPARASCRGSRSDRAGRPGGSDPRLRAGDGAGCEPFAAGLPGHHEVMAVGIAEGVDRGTERLVGVLVDVDQPGQRRGDTEVEPVALGVERVGHRLFDDRDASAS